MLGSLINKMATSAKKKASRDIIRVSRVTQSEECPIQHMHVCQRARAHCTPTREQTGNPITRGLGRNTQRAREAHTCIAFTSPEPLMRCVSCNRHAGNASMSQPVRSFARSQTNEKRSRRINQPTRAERAWSNNTHNDPATQPRRRAIIYFETIISEHEPASQETVRDSIQKAERG